jgi:hypothetical protein
MSSCSHINGAGPNGRGTAAGTETTITNHGQAVGAPSTSRRARSPRGIRKDTAFNSMSDGGKRRRDGRGARERVGRVEGRPDGERGTEGDDPVVVLMSPKAGGGRREAVVETTRGWMEHMPRGCDSSAEDGAIDLTGSEERQDDVQVVSCNVARERPSGVRGQRHVGGKRRAVVVGTMQNHPEFLGRESLLQGQGFGLGAGLGVDLRVGARNMQEEPAVHPTCGICFEPMGKSTERPMAAGNCGHVYCKECLMHAVKSRKKCPTCSAKMTTKQVRNIFFDV